MKVNVALEMLGLAVGIFYLGLLVKLFVYPPPFALSSVTGGSPCSGYALGIVSKDKYVMSLSPPEQYKKLKEKQTECELLTPSPIM